MSERLRGAIGSAFVTISVSSSGGQAVVRGDAAVVDGQNAGKQRDADDGT